MSNSEPDHVVPGDISEASGTAIARDNNVALVTQNSSDSSLSMTTEQPKTPTGEEETLESHEIIELQTFSERKAWIEEKIKFLEKMPPIEVFIGLEAIRASAEEVPGLPTQSELQQWLVEHDAIEKESEIFDTGELKKLRKFTRAATQRNLSPEDTDLIELTLTTIYALDKLLHLLRDRSENLDLLGIRLTWEGHRAASWRERRNIIADLKTFLESRARWSPSVYDTSEKKEEPSAPTRRGSQASVASFASDTSLSAPGFSRSTRFKLAELLSRDAAQFAGRVSSLRHGNIAAAGKILDKLIDNSRKPVPEELLDEQDKLEEKGINDLENIGKFVMNVVMQWRKADEIYVETLKDQTAARTLLEEIEVAKMQHPADRQSAAFISRADALVRRLFLRGKPTSAGSSFPCPLNPLFPEQGPSNTSLAQTLSAEISVAVDLAKKVEVLSKEYRATYEAVNQVETLLKGVQELSDTFTSIMERLKDGVPSGDGDGSPPNLMSDSCLDPTRHSVFLALLPSILEELRKADESAALSLRTLPAALLRLDFPGIDPDFKKNAASMVQSLSSLRAQAQGIRNDVVARTARLREARKIWGVMGGNLKELEGIRRAAADAMDKHRWRQATGHNDAPPTPDSPPTIVLQHNASSLKELEKQLGSIHDQLTQGVDVPLAALSGTLEVPLNDWLVRSANDLKGLLERMKDMAHLLDSIQIQAAAMAAIRNEFNDFQIHMENLKLQYDSSIQQTLEGALLGNDLTQVIDELRTDSSTARTAAAAFIDGMSQRVPFVSRHSLPPSQSPTFVKRTSSVDLTLGTLAQHSTIEIPLDLHTLDNSVRADSNAFAMRLNGELRSLEQKAYHLDLARTAKEVDAALASTIDDIDSVTAEEATLVASCSNIMAQGNIVEPLDALVKAIESSSQQHRSRVRRSFSPIRKLLRDMQGASGIDDASVHDALYLTRTRAVDDAELKFTAWDERIKSLCNQVAETRRLEVEKLEQERVAEESRIQAEKERLAAEEAERVRIEIERQAEEERRHLEEERAAEERRIAEEKRQVAAAKAEEERLERERFELAENQRLEETRKAEEQRLQMEKERLAAGEAERSRLERERADIEMKLRLAEEQLAEERRQLVERNRLAAIEAEQRRTRVEEETRLLEERERKLAAAESALSTPRQSVAEDVFGSDAPASQSGDTRAPKSDEFSRQISKLRKRLLSVGIDSVLRPVSGSASLPVQDDVKRMNRELSIISSEVTRLLATVLDSSDTPEVMSLKDEVEVSFSKMRRVEKLANLSEALQLCDAALSDLLEHIDSYPSPPIGSLSSSYQDNLSVPPEEQLSGRMAFCRLAVAKVSDVFAEVREDSRAIAERERILQTWSELEEMGNDRASGRKSRPSSVLSSGHNSSGRNSSASLKSASLKISGHDRKISGYSNLSVSSRGGLLVPSSSKSRRAVSGTSNSHERSATASQVFGRSTSGPLNFSTGTTYASRQRTTSLTPSNVTPIRRVSGTPLNGRSQTAVKKRSASPSVSNASSYAHSTADPSRSSTSTSTWSRAPRLSFTSLPRNTTPQKKPTVPRKTYVANPKSKLDVAVGDVVNNLPVGINIEGVSGSWKDQSGKYWIGDQDPKLCFCRILRSQTVMVRVGGGWTELSKFITNHFADSFRLLTASPFQTSTREERWISSATLLEAPEASDTPPMPPRTPEPRPPFLPSFSISTPSGKSPHSVKSTPSSKGSPLTPLQFMRRAEPETPLLRPDTPSKPSTARTRNMNMAMNTPNRNSVWRP